MNSSEGAIVLSIKLLLVSSPDPTHKGKGLVAFERSLGLFHKIRTNNLNAN